MNITKALKRFANATLPNALLGRLRLMRARRRYAGRSRQDIFSDIYDNKVWGASEQALYSGPGSRPENVTRYAAFVSQFVAMHQIKSLVDFGCGDFEAGRRIELGGAKYLGCDIVPLVIERNSRQFASDKISFRHFDVLGAEPYPDAELCLIRQVLQHCSNADVAKVLARLTRYRYVLVTDAQCVGDKSTRNFDIETFHETRTIYGSGLRLELPPFSIDAKSVLEYDYAPAQNERSENSPPMTLRTLLLEHQPASC
jgi:SAM-dependent methyltransferase